MRKKTFVFFYLMGDEEARISFAVPAHVEYWRRAKVNNYAGGPFSDRSGGLITFDAANLQEASGLVKNDPFVAQVLVSEYWVKEWLAE
jgi:uncharacterized protein YciI